MNHIYKTVWNEQTGTFVAVSENKTTKGKRSGSSVSRDKRASSGVRRAGGLAAMAAAGALLMGNALADVTLVDATNTIEFTGSAGTITNVGSITGLTSLTVGGALHANQITVDSDATLAADSKGVVRGQQLFQTNEQVATAKADIQALATQVTNLGTSVTTGSLNVGSGVLVASSDGVIVGTDLTMSGKTITGLAGGEINATSTQAVTGSQIHKLQESLFGDGAEGIKYFHANSTAPDSRALGDDSIAIGPDSVAEGDSSFVAGVGAIAQGESSIALGAGAKTSKPVGSGDPTAAIAIGKDSESSGKASTAIGQEASASGGAALALGAKAKASGAAGIALGEDAVADAVNNISIGKAAGGATGNHIPGDRSHNIAIGAASGQNVKGQFNLAMGDQAGRNVDGDSNVALGRGAGSDLKGEANVSIGWNANSVGREANRAVGIGQDTRVDTEGVAIGFGAFAGNTGVALGRHTKALGTGTAIGPNAHADSNHVALGLNSLARQADVVGAGRFTNRAFTGSAVSVGSGAPGGAFTRRIVNVEDGANDTDAVNVRQLQTVADQVTLGATVDYEKLAETVGGNWGEQIAQSKTKYVSINDGGVAQGNKDNNGADAVAIDSIAIGPDATTKNRDSIAIGHMAGAEGDSAVVLGHNIKGLGRNSTTIGNSQSEAHGESAVAIGTHVISRDKNSIVIGTDSYTNRQANGPSVENSIVIGTESSSTAVEGIVLGKKSVVNAARGIAQGSEAHATAADAMAFGTGAHATADDAQASGHDARAYAARGIALGTNARSGQAIPDAADAANNRDSIAIGSGAVAEMNSSIATGRNARATANFAQASGFNAQASGEGSIAQGHGATALSKGAVAMGAGAQSLATSAVAIGSGATASNALSVALGAGAATESAVGTTNASVNNISYGNFAGSSPIGTVSVGTGTDKRTITNVAAGRISGTSTDAINGSQLFATNTVLGNVAHSIGNGPGSILGGNAVVRPDGTLTMTDIGETGENTVHDAIKYAAQGWNISADGDTATNVAPGGSVDFGNTDDNILITRSGNGLLFNLSDDIRIGNSITVGDTTIVGNEVKVGGGNPIVISGDTGTIGGLTNKTFDPASYTSGQAATEDQLKSVSDVANAGWNVTDAGGNAANIGPNGVVTFSGGSNITVAQTGVDQAGVVEITLNENIDLGVDGSVKTGDTLMDNDGLTVDDGTGSTQVGAGTVTVTDAGGITTIAGNQVKVGGGNPIVISGDTGTIEGLTNLDLDGADFAQSRRAATEEQLSLVNRAANAGWNVTDAGGNVANIGPNGVVTFNGDGNITVAQTGVDQAGVVEIALNENIDLGVDGSVKTGDTLMDNTGVAVGDKVKLSNTGLTVEDDTGNQTSTTATGTTVTNALGDTTAVGAGVISVADAGGTTNIGGTQIVVGGVNSVTIDGGSGRIGGLTNKTFDPTSYTSGQAATEDQLKSVSDVANAGWNVTDAGGSAANIGPNGVVTFIGDSNITVTQTGADDDGVMEITLNEDIDLGPDGSLKIGGTEVNNDGVGIGPDVHLGKTGLVIVGGPSITNLGINAGGLVITNVAAGVDPGDAVNYGQLRPIESFVGLDGSGTFAYNGSQHLSLKDALDSMHWNVEAPAPSDPGSGSGGNGGTGGGSGGGGGGSGSTPIHNSNTLGFVEGDNIVISKTDRVNEAGQTVGADIKVAVSQDLKVNSITAIKIDAQSVAANEIAINNGGPIINQNGIDMSDNRITNMADGVAQNDAVNVGQLERATGNLQGQVNDLRGDMRRQNRKLSAGVAAAMATASLPQAYLPGKTMMGLAAGTWNGESGMALGFSGITDSGKWIYKLSGNATSRGDYGGAVGVGYQW